MSELLNQINQKLQKTAKSENCLILIQVGLQTLTHFPHHPQALLVVGPTASHKDGDLVLLQRALKVLDGPHDALSGTEMIFFKYHLFLKISELRLNSP